MKNKVFFSLIILFLSTSCKVFVLNTALENIGAFDEEVVISKLAKNNKEIVFIPMIHLSTKMFYDDVSKKVDSLQNENFFFYYEKISGNLEQDSVVRKIRKATALPFPKEGYSSSLDSILTKKQRAKLKKEIISQPRYSELGIEKTNSKNVDVSLKDIVDYYEKTNGEIKLEPCDFNNSVFEKSTCEKQKIDKEKYNDAIIAYRNSVVVNEILNDSLHQKIVVIYGAAHIEGIKESLMKNGYQVN